MWYNICEADIIPAPVRVEQSETNTLANHAHPLEGCHGFGEVMVSCSQKHSCYGNDCFLVTAMLFDTEITVANLRMLFAGNNSVGTLHQQWLDIASGLETPDRFS